MHGAVRCGPRAACQSLVRVNEDLRKRFRRAGSGAGGNRCAPIPGFRRGPSWAIFVASLPGGKAVSCKNYGGDSNLKAWPVVGIFTVQSLLLLAHWFIFHTWISFWGSSNAEATLALRAVMIALALSFIVAALLSFRFANPLVIFIYRIAATWLGFMTLFLVASFLCWAAWYGVPLAGIANPGRLRAPIAVVLFSAAVAAGILGMGNALWVRVKRVTVELPGLPTAWKGHVSQVSMAETGELPPPRSLEAPSRAPAAV